MRFESHVTLRSIKETGNYKATDLRTFTSNWCIKTFRFNGFGNGSRFTFVSEFGYWGDKDGTPSERNEIYSCDKDGNLLKIPYNDRFNPKYVSQVPYYKTYDIVTPAGANVPHLKNIVKAYEEGRHPSDESCTKFGIYSYEDAVNALKEAEKGVRHYVCEGDFQAALATMLNNGTFDNQHVRVTGDYSIRYSEQKGQFYKTFKPQKVVAGNFTHDEGMFLTCDLIYDKNALERVEGTEDFTANTFVKYYDNQYKTEDCGGWVMCPLVISLHHNQPAFPVLLKRFDKSKFVGGTKYRQWSVELQYVDGAEATDIKLEDLSEEEQEDIACGLRDFEDVKKAHGGRVYGERITEYRIYKSAGTPGDTEYTDVDFELPAHKKAEEAKRVVNDTISAEDDDDDMPFDI